ncbi:MAG: TonB-dependent receptor [Melioribacteraceae bacterium]|nr:MAG: TonB-dependent receptor [Melioribacteraceae bacterium]
MRSKLFTFLFVFVLAPFAVMAQTGNIKGIVTDGSGEVLTGVNVIVLNTTFGASTDANGEYVIKNIPAGDATVAVSMIGYTKRTETVTIVADRTLELNFSLRSVDVKLSEVVVAGNIAKERETPVAFTNVGEDEISKKFNVQDVPHLFANTPGVYVTSDGGSGMGDSKVFIRGFDEQRIAVMINNVPVNDPESKKVYWSNWGSLPAASQSIQVQRGVGSSLYGSGALGGSINVVTKDAPAAKSLGLTGTFGQYGIMKYGVDYNSGLMNDKFAFIGRVNYMQGNGWRQSTYYEGMQYYFSAMYFPNDKNTFKVILHGAPQYHAYSYYGFPAADFAKYGRDWNGHPHVAEGMIDGTPYADRGTSLFDVIFMTINPGTSFADQKGGLVIGNDRASFDNNVYHKPQFEIHHNYSMSDESKITTTFFVSKGYGYGENLNSYYKVARDANGLMTYNAINTAGSSVYQYRNYSDHFQTGILSNFSTRLMGVHDLSFGVELRYWDARHAGEVLNTFSNSDITYYIGNNGQKFGNGELYYDYTTTKPQFTTFAHALWRFGDLNIMTDLQFSTMNYNIKEDVPSSNNYPLSIDGTDKGNGTWVGPNGAVYSLWDYDKSYNFISPKLGANYNVTEWLNVFANWSMAVNEPRVKYFFGYGSPNDALDLEETSDIELGLGVNKDFGQWAVNGKYNFYNIAFDGKALQLADPTKANTPGYDYKGRRYIPIGESTYQGHEIALSFALPYNLQLGVNASFASNEWGEPENSEGAQYLYSNENVVAGVDYNDADGSGTWDSGENKLHSSFTDKFGNRVEVGMPQTIMGATLNYGISGFYFSAAMRYYQDIYVLEDNSEVAVEVDAAGNSVEDSATLPSAMVIDFVTGYELKLYNMPVNLSLHINNVLNEEYWQKGDNYGFLPGAERTMIFNLGIQVF